MAALFWNSEVRTLTPGTANIGELKGVIENELQRNGFLDVRRSELDVSGSKNGVFVSIAHFHIDGPGFWEVVMASGDDLNVTKNTLGEVADKLRRLVFFDEPFHSSPGDAQATLEGESFPARLELHSCSL